MLQPALRILVLGGTRFDYVMEDDLLAKWAAKP